MKTFKNTNLIINSMMFVLFVGMLLLPVTSLGLFDINYQSTNVLGKSTNIVTDQYGQKVEIGEDAMKEMEREAKEAIKAQEKVKSIERVTSETSKQTTQATQSTISKTKVKQ